MRPESHLHTAKGQRVVREEAIVSANSLHIRYKGRGTSPERYKFGYKQMSGSENTVTRSTMQSKGDWLNYASVNYAGNG